MMLPNLSSLRTSPLQPERLSREPVGKPARIGMPAQPRPIMAVPASFRKGGRVLRTGFAKVHKGEHIVTAADAALGRGKKRSLRKPTRGKRLSSAPAKRKIRKTMDEWKAGTLHSGSKKGPVVQDQKQAVAIAINQGKKAA